jgi:hypothetical protein
MKSKQKNKCFGKNQNFFQHNSHRNRNSQEKLIQIGLYTQFLNFVAEGKTLIELEQYAQDQIELILSPYLN